jgi:hypothetical protein
MGYKNLDPTSTGENSSVRIFKTIIFYSYDIDACNQAENSEKQLGFLQQLK